MKYFAIILLALGLATPAMAGSRDLIKMIPSESYFVLGSDVADLRDNGVFRNMEKSGQIWAFDENSGMVQTLAALKIDPKTDLTSFLFSRYINPYGSKGKVYIVELSRDPAIAGKESTPYLDTKLYRLDPKNDLYAVNLAPNVWALGSLTGVKTAVDVSRGKQEPLEKNNELKTLYGKVPRQAAFWGMALPFSRRQAAAQGSEQSTNAMLEAFENYYYYGIPSKDSVNAHFIGRAKSESEAAFVSTFMIGTLTFAKFKVQNNVAEMLDTVDVRREGLDIHVNGIVTKEITDSYFSGELGVK